MTTFRMPPSRPRTVEMRLVQGPLMNGEDNNRMLKSMDSLKNLESHENLGLEADYTIARA